MLRRPLVVTLVVLVALLGACRTGGRSAGTDTTTPFNRNLAGRPSGTTPTSVDGTTTTSASATATTITPSATTTTVARLVLDIADASGDAGGAGPAYADVARVEMRDLGRDLQVIVRVHATLPATLRPGEVVGIGVDLHRSTDDESDYQLFADGGVDGWFAYLATPKGFVAYPGKFALDGSSVTFVVPWTAVGGRAPARVGVFLDWTRRTSAGTSASEDGAPDDGLAPVRG